jgi:hypothetical protein
VIEHDLGYRGQFGYPQRVRLICPECFWWPPSPGSSAEVVAVLPKGTAVPFCGHHLEIARETGLSISALRRAIDVESMLLRTYAVDLAPAIEPRSDRPGRPTSQPSSTDRGMRSRAGDALYWSKE